MAGRLESERSLLRPSVQFKLAILSVLAKRPDGRATLDELRSEVEALTANDDEPEESSSALDEIDIFQSGLVTPEDGGFRITDVGRSALKALVARNTKDQRWLNIRPPHLRLTEAQTMALFNTFDASGIRLASAA